MEDFGALPFFVAFPLIWTAVVSLIARLGGWAQLAREYPATPRHGGCRFRFQSGRMRRGTAYGSCLTVGSDPMGLHLATFFIFRPGHPSIFIPWSDVSVREDRTPMLRGVRLSFLRAPDVPLVLSRSLLDKLAEASSGAFELRAC